MSITERLACLIGRHEWDECVCVRLGCRGVRAEAHTAGEDGKCVRCGTEGPFCRICGAPRRTEVVTQYLPWWDGVPVETVTKVRCVNCGGELGSRSESDYGIHAWGELDDLEEPKRAEDE